MDISVVVPVYNGRNCLRELVERLLPVLEAHAGDYEAIFVHDAGHDDSWTLIQQLAAEHTWVRGIDLMRNYGQHNALLCGIRAAHYEVIVTMDDDLQHPPEEIPKLLVALTDSVDVVYGRPEKQQQSLLRNLASAALKVSMRILLGSEVARIVSPFRAFRRDLRVAFADFRNPEVIVDVLLSWGTARHAAVDVGYRKRASGRSTYSLMRLVGLALKAITAFSTLPLRLASVLGLFFTLVGFVSFCFTLITVFIYGRTVPGFVFLAMTTSVFSGVQLFSLGIIGEYLARMHQRSMDQPTYKVRAETKTAGTKNTGQASASTARLQRRALPA